jgi:hypothetical protein
MGSNCTDPGRTGSDHAITITLGDDGELSVSSDSESVCINDTLSFSCATYPWAVQFIGMGKPKSSKRQSAPVAPFDVAGQAGESESITVTTKAVGGKTWDYVVAVFANGRIYTLDPEIVIGPRD